MRFKCNNAPDDRGRERFVYNCLDLERARAMGTAVSGQLIAMSTRTCKSPPPLITCPRTYAFVTRCVMKSTAVQVGRNRDTGSPQFAYFTIQFYRSRDYIVSNNQGEPIGTYVAFSVILGYDLYDCLLIVRILIIVPFTVVLVNCWTVCSTFHYLIWNLKGNVNARTFALCISYVMV